MEPFPGYYFPRIVIPKWVLQGPIIPPDPAFDPAPPALETDLSYGYIYCITNIRNNAKYIGQTKCFKIRNGVTSAKNPEERFRQHLSRAFGEKTQNECQKFYEAIREYGKDAFVFTIVEKCSMLDLNKRERYYIKLWNTKRKGYNISRGGKKKPAAYKRMRKRKG